MVALAQRDGAAREGGRVGALGERRSLWAPLLYISNPELIQGFPYVPFEYFPFGIASSEGGRVQAFILLYSSLVRIYPPALPPED